MFLPPLTKLITPRKLHNMEESALKDLMPWSSSTNNWNWLPKNSSISTSLVPLFSRLTVTATKKLNWKQNWALCTGSSGSQKWSWTHGTRPSTHNQIQLISTNWKTLLWSTKLPRTFAPMMWLPRRPRDSWTRRCTRSVKTTKMGVTSHNSRWKSRVSRNKWSNDFNNQ